MYFEQTDFNSLNLNPFTLIGNEWMLITAGNKNSFNTMTASWGGLGVLWNKKVSFCFVRPQRYTFEFLEKQDFYTLSFFPEKYKPALTLCGKVSGRDTNKIKDCGLTPVFDENAPYFCEANKVFVCRKMYSQFINPDCFIDENIEKCYPQKDYHKMFAGEIVKVLEAK